MSGIKTRAQKLKEEEEEESRRRSQSPQSMNPTRDDDSPTLPSLYRFGNNNFNHSPNGNYAFREHNTLNNRYSRSPSVESNRSNASWIKNRNNNQKYNHSPLAASEPANKPNDTITDDSDTDNSGGEWERSNGNSNNVEQENVSRDREPPKKQTSSKLLLLAALAVGFLLGFVAGGYYSSPRAAKQEQRTQTTNNDIMPIHSTLKTEFPTQSKQFYSSIMSCYLHSIINGKGPSIIMLVHDHATAPSASCIAKKLVKTLHEGVSYKLLMIDSVNFKNRDPDEVKEDLDRALVNIFSNYEAKIALIERIQHIPARAMLLFHSYGDDDEQFSRYNGVIILFTYELKDDMSPMNTNKQLTAFVEKKLTEDWQSSIEYDQLRPLFSRITNNVILLNNESNCE